MFTGRNTIEAVYSLKTARGHIIEAVQLYGKGRLLGIEMNGKAGSEDCMAEYKRIVVKVGTSI